MADSLFHSGALDTMAQLQQATMPDLALIYLRTTVHEPGGIVTETYAWSRTVPCSLARPNVQAQPVAEAPSEVPTWTLRLPRGTGLTGTEHVLVVSGGLHATNAPRVPWHVTVRILTSPAQQTHTTVDRCAVTDLDVEQLDVPDPLPT